MNAARTLAATVAGLPKGAATPIVAGIGTGGSLSLELEAGDVVYSLDSVVADWRHDDGRETLVGPYGTFAYGPPVPGMVEAMAIRSESPLLAGLREELIGRGFRTGRVLTSDAFIASREHKLRLGGTFGALACDMESGAFAWTAGRLGGLPWFNLRAVADTLDETLSDYFDKESDITLVLGERTLEALTALDGILDSGA
jgi:adenosylhomocysteine nucleosidase